MNPTNKVCSVQYGLIYLHMLCPRSTVTANYNPRCGCNANLGARVSRHVMLGTVAPLLGVGARGRAAADCSVMGPRRGEEVTLATRRRATAAHRPLARNTPPPAAETSAQPPPGQED